MAAWTITKLSRSTKIPQATLRYWERLGLLPRAARSHAGYRVFPPEAIDYVRFVRKSKGLGLSLQQMKRVLEMARHGRSPCPEVQEWVVAKLAELQKQILTLQKLERRLSILRRSFVNHGAAPDNSQDLCSLIIGLPEEKRFRERNSCTEKRRPDTECERIDAS